MDLEIQKSDFSLFFLSLIVIYSCSSASSACIFCLSLTTLLFQTNKGAQCCSALLDEQGSWDVGAVIEG